jgi:hypothetical protein
MRYGTCAREKREGQNIRLEEEHRMARSGTVWPAWKGIGDGG